jgi:hypothetical protein
MTGYTFKKIKEGWSGAFFEVSEEISGVSVTC